MLIRIDPAIHVKPCPFCGSIENLWISDRESFNELTAEHGYATIVIRCEHCYTEMYEHEYRGIVYENKVEHLIRKWNTRKEVNENADHEA